MNEFIDGLIVRRPHENAPDFIKAKISIKREALIKWLQKHNDEWINGDIKVSRENKLYVQVNDWKPNKQQDEKTIAGQKIDTGSDIKLEDIPF